MPSVALDLRSNAKCGVRNDPDPGLGLFFHDGRLWLGQWQWYETPPNGLWAAPESVDGYLDLGDDPLARMRAATRNAVADTLFLDRAALPDTDLADLLGHHIGGRLADPTGQNRVKPYRMNRRRGLRLRLGREFGVVLQEPFSESNPNFPATLAVRREDYRRNVSLPDRLTGEARQQWKRSLRTAQERRDGVELPEEEARNRWQTVLERWTGHEMLALYRRRGDDLLPDLVPQEYLDAGHSHRPPETTIGDTFTDTTDTRLGDHTATGGNGGFGWTEVVTGGNDQTDIESNEVNVQESTQRLDSRAESNLSGDDQRVKLTGVSEGSGSFRLVGPAARFSADGDGAQDLYFGMVQRSNEEARINKVVNDVESNIALTAFTINYPHDLQLDVDASDLELFVDDVSEVTGSDSAITGELKTGISMFRPSMRGDDFQGEDLPAVGGFPHSQAVIIG